MVVAAFIPSVKLPCSTARANCEIENARNVLLYSRMSRSPRAIGFCCQSSTCGRMPMELIPPDWTRRV